MMFTRLQKAILRVSALICLGFILGLSAVSPSFNPFLERNLRTLADSAAVQHQDVKQRHVRVGATDCSDLNSAECRNLRASYERYLGQGRDGIVNDVIAIDRVRSEPGRNARGDGQNEIGEGQGNLRVVTVFSGSTAREFLVPPEIN
jgi:hypothetical protein